ncbi:MAG: PH domain-containing protein [Phycisphaerae bacterium]|nr:PH domain-containing protein [Phycisphaerae bacterium]
MTPSPDAVISAPAEVAMPAGVLRDGEQIILTVKPSLWYVLICSWRALLLVAVVAGAYAMSWRWSTLPVWPIILPACFAIMFVQLLLGGFRWLGRLYVLTDRRVIRLQRGQFVDVRDCELSRISRVDVVHGRFERFAGLGSLGFVVGDNPYSVPEWICLSRPDEIADEVRKAISRCRR